MVDQQSVGVTSEDEGFSHQRSEIDQPKWWLLTITWFYHPNPSFVVISIHVRRKLFNHSHVAHFSPPFSPFLSTRAPCPTKVWYFSGRASTNPSCASAQARAKSSLEAPGWPGSRRLVWASTSRDIRGIACKVYPEILGPALMGFTGASKITCKVYWDVEGGGQYWWDWVRFRGTWWDLLGFAGT